MAFGHTIPRLHTVVAAMEKLLCWIAVCLPVLSWAESEHADIARFSQGDLSGWQVKVFAGETFYALREKSGRTVLHADSNATASGSYREVSVDLGKTPMLNRAWKVDNILTGNDERTRAGDDYSARMVAVESGSGRCRGNFDLLHT